MSNNGIRKSAKENGVKLWELADALGVSEATVTRKLRRELPDVEQEKVLTIIAEIAQKKKETTV